MKSLILAALLAGTAGAAAAQSPNRPAQAPARDVAVVAVTEPDRGGGPADGDIWRRSVSVGVEGQPGAVATRTVVANTPIPDSRENRRRFGPPISEGGRNTPPRPGPVP